MRNLLILSVTLLLNACDLDEELAKRTNKYIGQDVEVLFNAVGLPRSQGEIANRTFYAWTYQESGSYSVPTSETTVYEGSDGSSGTAKTKGYTYVDYNHVCVVRAFVNSRNEVTSFDMDGDLDGCFELVNRF